LLALPGLAMTDDIGALTVRTVQNLKDHDATQWLWGYCTSETLIEDSISTPLEHLQLVVIDGLCAFKGSANLTQTAWRSAAQGMDHVEVVSNIEEVASLHNRLFSPVWGRMSNISEQINMDIWRD
jgi:hypothetical protein